MALLIGFLGLCLAGYIVWQKDQPSCEARAGDPLGILTERR